MIAAALFTSLLISLVGDVSAAPSLSLKILGSTLIKDVDNFSVTAIIFNTGDMPLKLYKDPRSALSSFPEHTFTISSESGAEPAFVGAHAKYEFRTATSFVHLDPGANVSVTHDLAMGYEFGEEGDYEVDASSLFHYQDADGNPQPLRANVTTAYSAKVGGSLRSAKRPSRVGIEKRATFTGCSASRRTVINTALRSANNYVAVAVTYLTRLKRGSNRYTTWFGAYSTSRKATVLRHFKRIQTSDPRKYRYDCSTCTEDYYAYTYSGQFGVVYLCKNFWTSPSSGSDSQAGTIIHEASHFTRNGDTDDHAYGKEPCKALAKSTPSKAIHNADSHEYFAENTPNLS